MTYFTRAGLGFATPGRGKSVREEIARAVSVLRAAGVASPEREALRLLALASFGRPPEKLSPWLKGRFRRLVAARGRGTPLPLLEGETGFLDFDLEVCPGVLIPRPETEELAELALAAFREAPPHPLALDLGTGTGALAVALARARPDAQVVAVDIDRRALVCARRNVLRHGLGDRVELRRSDWFARVPESFHLVVANPPYIATSELPRLPREVRDYEPRRALDGGDGGMEHLLHILRLAPRHLLPGGRLLLELAPHQAPLLREFAKHTPSLVEVRVEKDLAGKERFLICRCR